MCVSWAGSAEGGSSRALSKPSIPVWGMRGLIDYLVRNILDDVEEKDEVQQKLGRLCCTCLVMQEGSWRMINL